MTNVFYNARQTQLTPPQEALLARFGLTGDAQMNRARLAKHAGEPRGTNAYRAVQLARAVASGKYGSARRRPPPKVDWKRELRGVSSKANYDRRLAKARGDAAKTRALRGAYKARRRNGRAEAVATMAARKAKLARIRRDTRGGPRSFAVNVQNSEKARDLVASSLAALVGVVQDLMAVSGASLSRTFHSVLRRHTGSAARAGLAAAATLTPTVLLRWVATNVLRKYGVEVDAVALGGMFQRAKGTVLAILANKNVDMRPLVKAVVMSVEAEQVRAMAANIVKDVLDTYVYSKYSSSSEGGMMCKLCSSTPCGQPQSQVAYNPKHALKLASLLGRAMTAINGLLSVEARGLTLTKVLRQVADTYLGDKVMGAVQVTTKWGISTALSALVAAGHPLVNAKLKQYGLSITQKDLMDILWNDIVTIRAFAHKDFSRPLDPVLVKIVVKAQPVGLLRGVAGAALKGRGSSQFCALCKSTFPACAR